MLPPAVDPRRLRARAGRSGALLPLRGPSTRRRHRRLLLVLADLRRGAHQQLRGPSGVAAARASAGRCWPTSWPRRRRSGRRAPRSRCGRSNLPAIAPVRGRRIRARRAAGRPITPTRSRTRSSCGATRRRWRRRHRRMTLNRPAAGVRVAPKGRRTGRRDQEGGGCHMTDSEETRRLLLASSEAFRQLSENHHALDDRLKVLATKPHLTDDEQFQEVTLEEREAAAEGSDGGARPAPRLGPPEFDACLTFPT